MRDSTYSRSLACPVQVLSRTEVWDHAQARCNPHARARAYLSRRRPAAAGQDSLSGSGHDHRAADEVIGLTVAGARAFYRQHVQAGIELPDGQHLRLNLQPGRSTSSRRWRAARCAAARSPRRG